jgi:hypothetical protein
MGYPVAECRADGSAVITKPRGTGGRVVPETVGEQMLYEIGDPGAYLMPEVVCDWRGVSLVQDGVDRVLVSGARGSAPSTRYKVTATSVEGYRALTTALFAGAGATGKARRMAEAIVARTERLIVAAGFTPLTESSIEVVGAGDVSGDRNTGSGGEAVVKVGVKHAERAALEIFSTEFVSYSLVAQGMTGFFAGRPRVAPSIVVHHLLVPKADFPVRVVIGETDADERAIEIEVSPGSPDAVTSSPALDEPTVKPSGSGGRTVPLAEVAVARSGDKGNLANIGVIARKPEYVEILHSQVTAERVAAHLAHLNPGPIRRWALPGINAINIVIDEVLGGTGGTSTLRYDPQGKSYAAMLLTLPVEVS